MQFNLKYQIKISCLITDLQAVKKSKRKTSQYISKFIVGGGGTQGGSVHHASHALVYCQFPLPPTRTSSLHNGCVYVSMGYPVISYPRTFCTQVIFLYFSTEYTCKNTTNMSIIYSESIAHKI